MPDKKGRLSDEELTKALKWVNEKSSKPCHVCGKSGWVLDSDIGSLTVFNYPATVFPMLVAACENCYAVRFFNAVMMGFVPGVEKKGGNAKQ